MTDLPTISVIVVSWQRPTALRRCLLALGQQDHPQLELIVVADAAALEQTRQDLAAARRLAKLAVNAAPNISVARNIGLALAAGTVVAFIDDDAVPEPSWASRLCAPFAAAEVVAATGYTRGRNGLSFQWTAAEVDQTGQDHPLPLSAGVSLHRGTALRAVKPVGTNCAFRGTVLRAIGGFDPAYRFYLEDADIALRLAGHGLTAVVPAAQVHHGFAASARRRADRVPLSLHEIGASSMVFLRRHAAPGLWPDALARLRAEQRARVLRHMVDGRIEPGGVGPLLATLEAGLSDGAGRVLDPLVALDTAPPAFLALPGTGPRPGRVIAGRIWQRARLIKAAQAAVQAGHLTTVFRFSPTILRHRHGFHTDGYWEQWGGLFGAADRAEPVFRLWSFPARLRREAARWAELRPIPAPPDQKT